jgi:hypothetical protein
MYSKVSTVPVRYHLPGVMVPKVCHAVKKYRFRCGKYRWSSVPDPDPPDPHVFGPHGSGSGSISQRFGSGSFYH